MVTYMQNRLSTKEPHLPLLTFHIPVIAITGTNGKTTTKELINSVLTQKYNTLATLGNLNNHIGVPLTLLNISKETEVAIIEMGANHPGEINMLCHIAEPDFGIITNIGKAHLEGFGGFTGVVTTKTELYRYIKSRNGKLFINKDNQLLLDNAPDVELITYGTPPAAIALTSVSTNPFIELEIVVNQNTPLSIHSHLYGDYNVENILAAVCIGNHFGVDLADITLALGIYEPSNNRSQLCKTKSNLLILDAYNANPSSMEAALTTFANTTYDNKVIILGDMLELGQETDTEHNRILELIESKEFSQVYLVGPVFTRINTRRENICFHDSELALLWFEHHRLENSAILIKGSRGIKLETIAGLL